VTQTTWVDVIIHGIGRKTGSDALANKAVFLPSGRGKWSGKENEEVS